MHNIWTCTIHVHAQYMYMYMQLHAHNLLIYSVNGAGQKKYKLSMFMYMHVYVYLTYNGRIAPLLFTHHQVTRPPLCYQFLQLSSGVYVNLCLQHNTVYQLFEANRLSHPTAYYEQICRLITSITTAAFTNTPSAKTIQSRWSLTFSSFYFSAPSLRRRCSSCRSRNRPSQNSPGVLLKTLHQKAGWPLQIV